MIQKAFSYHLILTANSDLFAWEKQLRGYY